MSEEQRSGFFGDQQKWSEHTYRMFDSLKLLVHSNVLKPLSRNIIQTSIFSSFMLVTMDTLVDSYETASAGLQLVQGGNDPSPSLFHPPWVRTSAVVCPQSVTAE